MKVDVFKSAQRNNALPTLIAGFFGMSSADIVATATAQVVPANAEICVKPWTIPDKWIEKQCPPEQCPSPEPALVAVVKARERLEGSFSKPTSWRPWTGESPP